jgi:hypothetical protein
MSSVEIAVENLLETSGTAVEKEAEWAFGDPKLTLWKKATSARCSVLGASSPQDVVVAA